ncbi:hypothetical protein NDU88_009674 [Pleurodeles waltl]|uniref:Uncharacterized protein n=1 Tax=Pleurodeles waltl TaxID=8319 RepID=A0AAV7QVZ2_PLEWA|nr:hypothetical protein NDU88_009674 [Pleurodeles waltl]
MLRSRPDIHRSGEEAQKNEGPILEAEELRPAGRTYAISCERARRHQRGTSKVEPTRAALRKTGGTEDRALTRPGLGDDTDGSAQERTFRGALSAARVRRATRTQIDPQSRACHFFPLSHEPVGLKEGGGPRRH